MWSLPVLSDLLAEPGRDAAQPILEEIARLVMAGELRACGERGAAAVREGVTDIRVISAYLLGVFEERGPEALADILGMLRESIGQHWDKLRPAHRKPHVVDSSLGLLFRVIRSDLEFHAEKRDELWHHWATTVAADLCARTMEACAALADALKVVIEEPRSVGELARLSARADLSLRAPAELPNAAAVEPAPQPEPAGDDEQSVADEAATTVEVAVSEEAAGDEERESAQEVPVARLSLELSEAMQGLIRKLQAFETLVTRSEMAKAAVVAQDLQSLMNGFDPRVYLPGLLASHFRLLSRHIAEIAPHWQAADDPVWQARQQLYKVDLDGFLDS